MKMPDTYQPMRDSDWHKVTNERPDGWVMVSQGVMPDTIHTGAILP